MKQVQIFHDSSDERLTDMTNTFLKDCYKKGYTIQDLKFHSNKWGMSVFIEYNKPGEDE